MALANRVFLGVAADGEDKGENEESGIGGLEYRNEMKTGENWLRAEGAKRRRLSCCSAAMKRHQD